jgi:hypothetical protein
VSRDKPQTFSMVTGNYVSGCAEKNSFVLHSLFALNDASFINQK